MYRAGLEKWRSHVAAVRTYADIQDAIATLSSAIEAAVSASASAAAAAAAAAPAPTHTLGDAAAEQASTRPPIAVSPFPNLGLNSCFCGTSKAPASHPHVSYLICRHNRFVLSEGSLAFTR